MTRRGGSPPELGQGAQTLPCRAGPRGHPVAGGREQKDGVTEAGGCGGQRLEESRSGVSAAYPGSRPARGCEVGLRAQVSCLWPVHPVLCFRAQPSS